MRQTTILMTCVGGPTAPFLIRSLKNSRQLNVRVVGTDMDPAAPGRSFTDVFEPLPNGNADDYCDRLIDFCRRERVEVVIPGSDEEALALAREQERLHAEGIVPCCPPMGMAKVMANKADMYELLIERGIPVPEFYRVRSGEELVRAAMALGYPEHSFCIKPTVARGGRGVWVVSKEQRGLAELSRSLTVDAIDLDTLLAAAERGPFPEQMTTPFFPGDMFDVDVLAKDGVTHYMIPRRRYHVRTTPFRGCWIDRHQGVLDLAGRVQEVLKLPYLFDFDIILEDEETPWVLEVNPRMSASTVVSVFCGISLVEYLVMLALGMEVPKVDIPWGAGGKPIVGLVAAEHGDNN